MTLRTLMQAGPAKANELFTTLSETSDGALKTRERLFAELKTELEIHTDLEEKHLFPVLRKHADTKELVAAAIRDNKELRAAVAELDALPKNDETFLAKLVELRKAFRQHSRDEMKGLLPAVQTALSEEQVQGITEKMETSLVEVEQAKQAELEEKRMIARQEREAVEAQAQQEEAAERKRKAVARHSRETVSQATKLATQTVKAASESVSQVARNITDSSQRVVAAAAAAPVSVAPFWDMWLGMSGLQRSTVGRNAAAASSAPAVTGTANEEQVIPLAEEILTVGKRKVSSGTTRVHRYVVETAVEKQVTLVHERVVVERRRPVTDEVSGEMLTELTIEVVETDEVPIVGKILHLKEEVVVRTERTEHVETVRDTLRQDEVKVEHSDARQPGRRQHAAARG